MHRDLTRHHYQVSFSFTPPSERQRARTLALRMTLQLGPIQTTRMNFSRLDSLSFAYCTRAYAYDALLSSSWSRSSGSPPDPVAVSFSLSERSDCPRQPGSRKQMIRARRRAMLCKAWR